MFKASTRLGASHRALVRILKTRPNLREGGALSEVLDILAARRRVDLTDLSPAEQAELVGSRARDVLPSVGRLAALLSSGRRLVVKYGIDPTAADVHIGHAVPMTVASRLQRMGHRVVFIVGDITARIGDPSGRSAERSPLTDEDIRRNLATYREQVTPFVDFDRADFRFNSEWLTDLTLPRFIGVLAKVPLSAALQREDFRGRLASGGGVTVAELVYSVVMALDSVEVRADIELGGLDQLLNMQMCRRVMEDADQPPEVVVATGLIEGTDGSGAKMSKSRGNYIGLAAGPKDVFGKLMSVPDRLLTDYLRSLTELLDPEIELLSGLHPMGVKTLLAAEVTSTIHGVDSALASSAGFTAQFSRRRLSEATGTPTVRRVDHSGVTLAQLFTHVARVVPSLNHVRRVAAGGGLRLVVETADGGHDATVLTEADATLASVLRTLTTPGRTFLTCGRQLIEIV